MFLGAVLTFLFIEWYWLQYTGECEQLIFFRFFVVVKLTRFYFDLPFKGKNKTGEKCFYIFLFNSLYECFG